MKKILFTTARYSDYRQDIFDSFISPRNQEYCEKHGFKYVEIGNNEHLPLIRGNPIWWKFSIVKQLMNTDTLQDGDIITCMDADMYIVDLEKELVPTKPFTYAIDSGNTHCMGWCSIEVTEWTRNLVDNIMSEYRFNKLYNKITMHEAFNTYSSFWQQFCDQASWYSLAGIKRHSQESFLQMKNFGFHSDKTEDTVYSIADLNRNVHILPTEWNVTEWESESGCQFNINKVEKENVIIRHFAGGQDWNNYKNWIK